MHSGTREKSPHPFYGVVMSKVEYRLPSHPYKRQCAWCVKDATQEAFKSQGNLTAISPCCDDPRCMRRAADRCESTVGAA
jgi:hypothetical protein